MIELKISRSSVGCIICYSFQLFAVFVQFGFALLATLYEMSVKDVIEEDSKHLFNQIALKQDQVN